MLNTGLTVKLKLPDSLQRPMTMEMASFSMTGGRDSRNVSYLVGSLSPELGGKLSTSAWNRRTLQVPFNEKQMIKDDFFIIF